LTEAAGTILDASALLAYLRDEPGADIVEQTMGAGALIASVNWAEVLSRLVDGAEQDIGSIVSRLRGRGIPGGLLAVVPLTEEDAVAIARHRPATRPFGLSLADRAALAMAQRLGVPILTADRVWQQVKVGISIRLIR